MNPIKDPFYYDLDHRSASRLRAMLRFSTVAVLPKGFQVWSTHHIYRYRWEDLSTSLASWACEDWNIWRWKLLLFAASVVGMITLFSDRLSAAALFGR